MPTFTNGFASIECTNRNRGSTKSFSSSCARSSTNSALFAHQQRRSTGQTNVTLKNNNNFAYVDMSAPAASLLSRSNTDKSSSLHSGSAAFGAPSLKKTISCDVAAALQPQASATPAAFRSLRPFPLSKTASVDDFSASCSLRLHNLPCRSTNARAFLEHGSFDQDTETPFTTTSNNVFPRSFTETSDNLVGGVTPAANMERSKSEQTEDLTAFKARSHKFTKEHCLAELLHSADDFPMRYSKAAYPKEVSSRKSIPEAELAELNELHSLRVIDEAGPLAPSPEHRQSGRKSGRQTMDVTRQSSGDLVPLLRPARSFHRADSGPSSGCSSQQRHKKSVCVAEEGVCLLGNNGSMLRPGSELMRETVAAEGVSSFRSAGGPLMATAVSTGTNNSMGNLGALVNNSNPAALTANLFMQQQRNNASLAASAGNNNSSAASCFRATTTTQGGTGSSSGTHAFASVNTGAMGTMSAAGLAPLHGRSAAFGSVHASVHQNQHHSSFVSARTGGMPGASQFNSVANVSVRQSAMHMGAHHMGQQAGGVGGNSAANMGDLAGRLSMGNALSHANIQALAEQLSKQQQQQQAAVTPQQQLTPQQRPRLQVCSNAALNISGNNAAVEVTPPATAHALCKTPRTRGTHTPYTTNTGASTPEMQHPPRPSAAAAAAGHHMQLPGALGAAAQHGNSNSNPSTARGPSTTPYAPDANVSMLVHSPLSNFSSYNTTPRSAPGNHASFDDFATHQHHYGPAGGNTRQSGAAGAPPIAAPCTAESTMQGLHQRSQAAGIPSGLPAFVPLPSYAPRMQERAPEQLETWMLRNIPCRFDQNEVMQILDSVGLEGKYNFFYLPIDIKKTAFRPKKSNANNKGYAFINLRDKADADWLFQLCHEQRFWDGHWKSNSRKNCQVKPAKNQGFLANAMFYKTEVLDKGAYNCETGKNAAQRKQSEETSPCARNMFGDFACPTPTPGSSRGSACLNGGQAAGAGEADRVQKMLQDVAQTPYIEYPKESFRNSDDYVRYLAGEYHLVQGPDHHQPPQMPPPQMPRQHSTNFFAQAENVQQAASNFVAQQAGGTFGMPAAPAGMYDQRFSGGVKSGITMNVQGYPVGMNMNAMPMNWSQ